MVSYVVVGLCYPLEEAEEDKLGDLVGIYKIVLSCDLIP
jgi:hypothetical protein